MGMLCFLSQHISQGSEEISGSTLLKVATLLTVLTVTSAMYVLRKTWEEADLPPGPRGLPLLGFLPFLKSELHQYFADLASTYGTVFSLRLGSKLCVVINSPIAAKEALKDHDAIFGSHDVPATALASVFHGKDVLWVPYGALWRTLRKVVVRELLSPATMASLYPLRRREVARMVETVQRWAGKSVNLRELISATTMNVTTMMLWGDRVAGERDALGEEFRALTAAYVKILGKPNVSEFFPVLARFDLQGLGRQIHTVSESIRRIFDAVIEQRRRTLTHGHVRDYATPDSKKDFLQVVLALLEKEEPAPLTMQHIKGLLLDLVLGAADTTSAVVEWVMAELLSNPTKMKKVKDEIAATVGDDGAVEESHLSSLRYLAAAVKEVLRLHPVLPLLFPYQPSAACTIAGHRIPKGAKVIVNAWAIQRDTQTWKDASVFEPERFLLDQEVENIRATSYLPFGAGRRICPGIALGERMTMFMVASLLHKLDWNVPDGETLDLSEQFGILMRKRDSLIAVPTLHAAACVKN